ncbi:MAG: lipoate--protein ligase [Bacteroidales bacterium]|nr:lipoate--protein ligase [Bacteroidales bacterium]
MLCINIQNNNPFFNLASEEYFLRFCAEDCFLLWISEPAVIVGKHQIAQAEINPRFVHNHDIPVLRRLSGGGTVYHDAGNLNFSFITNEEPGHLIDFKRYALPVIRFLEFMGIQASMSKKNEITAHGMKISGNAGHVYKNRVLHHGTLLYNSDLQNLRNALSDNTERYHSRAVQSNRTQVANIADFMTNHLDIETFSIRLLDYIQKTYMGRQYYPNASEMNHISQLASVKYAQWEWIYGYSPEYRFEHEFHHEGFPVSIHFTVQKGIIHESSIKTNMFSKDSCNTLSGKLNGNRHSWEDFLAMARTTILPGIHAQKVTDFFMENFF